MFVHCNQSHELFEWTEHTFTHSHIYHTFHSMCAVAVRPIVCHFHSTCGEIQCIRTTNHKYHCAIESHNKTVPHRRYYLYMSSRMDGQMNWIITSLMTFKNSNCSPKTVNIRHEQAPPLDITNNMTGIFTKFCVSVRHRHLALITAIPVWVPTMKHWNLWILRHTMANHLRIERTWMFTFGLKNVCM